MQENSTSANLYIPVLETLVVQTTIENYCEQLEQYHANYRKTDYYWQVGETSKVQGWILSLSVIAPQITALLHCLLPLLLERKVCFKVVKNRVTARNILDGNLGYEQLGKVIRIYPENDQEALGLAQQLVKLTTSYRGPVIPTDIHLGGTVFTRYGSINAIQRLGMSGEMEEYIYDFAGDLIKDNYSIPFKLPPGIAWPFGELASVNIPRARQNLGNIYRPIAILKPDPRGNVIKALYLKSLFQVRKCVIKVGKKNMLADDMGRDIQDRLSWQRDLHNELAKTVPLPRILDFFEENGETYLVMEFIKGKSLHDSLIDIHGNQRNWFQLSKAEQTKILNWLTQIVLIIETLHQSGFVHRDIQPGNFIVDSQDKIKLIDTELAYNLRNSNQEPPFELGTPGFMSPEQESVNIPTDKEDIYGLGALMITIFTCINASRLSTKNLSDLFQNLTFFIHHEAISNLICKCLCNQPSQRPTIDYIKSKLENYKNELMAVRETSEFKINPKNWNDEHLNSIIQEALTGLNQEPMPISDGIWLSKTIKTETGISNSQKEFSPSGGIHTGMTGVLYLLARAKTMGFDLGNNIAAYKQSWKYIYSEYLKDLQNFSPGLYSGSAGVALALAEGIKANLLEDSQLTREYIQKCLEKPNKELTLAEGVAGQGIVLLQCDSYMLKDINRKYLRNCIISLLSSQRKDGSWNTKFIDLRKQYSMSINWSHGISGIIYFLLAYNSRYEDKHVKLALNKSLTHLRKRTQDLKSLFVPSPYRKLFSKKPEIGDERTSAILCFILAYDILRDHSFKEAAETALYQYPDFIVNNNFSQDGGMAALGEVYIEAWQSFKNQEWKKRADQIVSFFHHTKYKNKSESCYWLTDETRKPSADLLTGNSGIIHFLLRNANPSKLGHILLR